MSFSEQRLSNVKNFKPTFAVAKIAQAKSSDMSAQIPIISSACQLKHESLKAS
jgi:hypothetical protein